MPERPVHGRLTVDLAGLREISADLRRDTDEDLRPGFATAQRQMRYGARFCLALDCAEGRAARHSVTEVLRQHHANAAYQLQMAEQLATALEQIVENYAAADARSASRIAEVAAELGRVFEQLEQPVQPAQGPPLKGMLP